MKFTAELTQGLCLGAAVHLLDLPDARRGRGDVNARRLPITQGADKLATYRFNTRTAEHHFCTVCGIYTHHKRRSNPDQLGVNVACLEGVSPFDFGEVVVLRRRAPSGRQCRAPDLYAPGVLRFEPAPDAEQRP